MSFIKKTGAFLLALLLMISGITIAPGTTTYAAETKTNPVVKLVVTYDGGTLIVGKSVAKSNLTVTALLKNGARQELSNYTIKTKKVTSENFKLTVTYKNKAGNQISASTTIKAITDFKSVKASLKDDVSLDYGDKLTKSMFDVSAVLSNGKTKVLDESSYSLSKTKYDADGRTSMQVVVSATNAAGKEKKTSVTVKALKAVKSISIKSYNGEAKDINDKLTTDDFEVEGITYGGESVAIKNFTLDPPTLEKASVSVRAVYTNSLGKTLKSRTQKIIADKCIREISNVEYVGTEKQIGDSISTSDFKVTGKTYGNDAVDISDFDISDTTVTSKSQSVRISYTNTAGSKLSKTVKLSAGNRLEFLSAELRRDKKVGDTIAVSDFKITGTYHDGSKKTISQDISLDKTVVDSTAMTVTLTYTDNTGNTVVGYCTFDAEDTVTSDDGVNITCTKNGQYKVGDVVSATDFTGTATTAAGQTVEITDFSIKSGSKLTGTTNTVVVSYKVGDISGTKTLTIMATDVTTGVKVEVINDSAYAADNFITGSDLKNIIRVSVGYASGEANVITDIMNDSRVKSIKAEGNVNLKTSGTKYKLKSGANKFTLTFEDTANGIERQAIDFTITPTFKKSEVTITQNKSKVYLDAGEPYTLASLVDVKNATNGINLIANSGKTGYPTVTVTAGSGAKVNGQVITFIKGNTSGKITVSTNVTTQYIAKKATFTYKLRSLKTKSASATAGKTYAVSTFASSNDTSTTIKMEIISGANYASVSSNKLVAKKAGTVKIRLTQGATTATATVKITK